MKLSVYQANGFLALDKVPEAGLVSIPVAAGVNIVQGDYIVPDGAGYATNTATAAQVACFGIAAENADNTSGAAGAIEVRIIPIEMGVRYSVPVATNAVIARANVGTCVDLEANDDVDISDITIVASAFGFWIEDFDASAQAVDGNTFGYAIGRFKINA